MFKNILIAAGLLGLAQAQSYTPPGAQTFGALYTPDGNNPVTRGETTTITWNPAGHTTDGSTVSFVLCKGGLGNCVNAPTAILTGVPAKNAQVSWTVPCSLDPGVKSTATGYGMLIIVDGTGEFQYSTQFSVLEGTKCGGSGSNSSTTTISSSTTYKSSSSSSSSMYSVTTWGSWNGTSTTTPYTTHKTTTAPVTTSTPVRLTTTTPVTVVTPTASATPSQFKGAADKIGASAVALFMAAGAAFFAL